MELSIKYPGFENRNLSLRTAGFFAGAKVVIDNAEVKGKGNVFLVRNNDGKEIEIKLKGFLDPIPVLDIEGKKIRVVDPLKWYQYVWSGLPILMAFGGGAIGGGLGFMAFWINARLFRSEKGAVTQYALSGIVSVLSFTVFLIAATAISGALGSK